MNQMTDEMLAYCEQFSTKDSYLLRDITAKTYQKEEIPQMICGQLVGGLLNLLVKISGAVKILEVGTFTGYSALQMAEALPKNGRLFTCELEENHIETAQSWFDKSDHGGKISILEGPALNSFKQFSSGYFDFVFIDADKVNYPNYYKHSVDLLKPGGLIVLDNMLWGGSVLNPDNEDSIAIRKTSEIIAKDSRVNQVMLPVRDGIMVCLKK